jgi:hypothetical protein
MLAMLVDPECDPTGCYIFALDTDEFPAVPILLVQVNQHVRGGGRGKGAVEAVPVLPEAVHHRGQPIHCNQARKEGVKIK